MIDAYCDHNSINSSAPAAERGWWLRSPFSGVLYHMSVEPVGWDHPIMGWVEVGQWSWSESLTRSGDPTLYGAAYDREITKRRLPGRVIDY